MDPFGEKAFETELQNFVNSPANFEGLTGCQPHCAQLRSL